MWYNFSIRGFSRIVSSRTPITLAARKKTYVVNKDALVKYRSDENTLAGVGVRLKYEQS